MSSGVAFPLNIMFSPVAYFNDAQVDAVIRSVIANMRANESHTLKRSAW